MDTIHAMIISATIILRIYVISFWREIKSIHLISDMESRHSDLSKLSLFMLVVIQKITPTIDYVWVHFPQTEFVNLVEPDTLSFETPESL